MTESTAPQPERYAFGKFSIDRTDRSVVLPDGSTPDLTSAEFDLLWALVCHAGEVVSRDDLMLQLRGVEFDGLDRTIDGRISKLRRKLRDDASNPQRIKTIRSKGYQFSKHAWNDAAVARRRHVPRGHSTRRPGAEMIRRTRSHPDAPPLPTLRYVKWRWLHFRRAWTDTRADRIPSWSRLYVRTYLHLLGLVLLTALVPALALCVELSPQVVCMRSTRCPATSGSCSSSCSPHRRSRRTGGCGPCGRIS